MKKRWKVLILAVIMTLSMLTGCGSAPFAPVNRAADVRMMQRPEKLSPRSFSNYDANSAHAAAVQGWFILNGLDADITFPGEDNFLPTMEVRYTKSTRGEGIYLFSRTPNVGNYMDYMTAVIPDNTQVTVLAKEAGAACVVTEDGYIGWVNEKFLAAKPSRVGYDNLFRVNTGTLDTMHMLVNDVVQAAECSGILMTLDAAGNMKVIIPDGPYQADAEKLLGSVRNWKNIKEFIFDDFGVIGLKFDGSIVYVLESSLKSGWENNMRDFLSCRDVIDISLCADGPITAVCADGMVYCHSYGGGWIAEPGAVKAAANQGNLFVLNCYGEVTQYIYDEKSAYWQYAGVALSGAKDIFPVNSANDFGALAILNDGRAVKLSFGAENNYYVDGFENIISLAVWGGVIMGCDSDGFIYLNGPEQLVDEYIISMNDWDDAIYRVYTGENMLFGLN